jgi:hypothetical protein
MTESSCLLYWDMKLLLMPGGLVLWVSLDVLFSNLSSSSFLLIFDSLALQDVTAEWEVRAMPTFLFIKDGKQLDKIVGANKDELERKCSQYASTPVASTA